MYSVKSGYPGFLCWKVPLAAPAPPTVVPLTNITPLGIVPDGTDDTKKYGIP